MKMITITSEEQFNAVAALAAEPREANPKPVELGTVKKRGGRTAYILRADDQDWLFTCVPTFQFSHDELNWKTFDSEAAALEYVCSRFLKKTTYHTPEWYGTRGRNMTGPDLTARDMTKKEPGKCSYCDNPATTACQYCSMALCDLCRPAHERILCTMKPLKLEYRE